MPVCRICKTRIPLSTTGVEAYRCRICGKTFCRTHFVIPRGVCMLCAGFSEEEALKRKNPRAASLIKAGAR